MLLLRLLYLQFKKYLFILIAVFLRKSIVAKFDKPVYIFFKLEHENIIFSNSDWLPVFY